MFTFHCRGRPQILQSWGQRGLVVTEGCGWLVSRVLWWAEGCGWLVSRELWLTGEQAVNDWWAEGCGWLVSRKWMIGKPRAVVDWLAGCGWLVSRGVSLTGQPRAVFDWWAGCEWLVSRGLWLTGEQAVDDWWPLQGNSCGRHHSLACLSIWVTAMLSNHSKISQSTAVYIYV